MPSTAVALTTATKHFERAKLLFTVVSTIIYPPYKSYVCMCHSKGYVFFFFFLAIQELSHRAVRVTCQVRKQVWKMTHFSLRVKSCQDFEKLVEYPHQKIEIQGVSPTVSPGSRLHFMQITLKIFRVGFQIS